MPPNLVVVESGAKSKIIEKYLNQDVQLSHLGAFRVVACFGHIYELPLKSMAVDVRTWAAEHVPIAEKAKTISSLRTAARAAKTVWLATDPDREGHAIARDLMNALDIPDGHRVVFHEITPSALRDAFLHPGRLPKNMVDAQETRRILDRVTGYETSPLLWRRFSTPTLSAGRVQSAALKMIVDRYKAVASHVPHVAWTVAAQWTVKGLHVPLDTHAYKIGSKPRAKVQWDDATAVQNWMRDVSSEWALAVVEKARVQNPPAPFTTSTLQQEAYARHGIPIARTMQLAQGLYESGHITYMRTDSTSLSATAQAAILAHVRDIFGEAAAVPRTFKSRAKNAQEAHECIRPTDPCMHTLSTSDTRILPGHQKIYHLIWRQTVASQMAAAQYAQFACTITGRTLPAIEFRGAYDTLLDEGFLRVARPEERARPTECAIWRNWMASAAGRSTPSPMLTRLVATAGVSRPDALYTESTLVKALECNGIGRPSTFTTTLDKLAKKGYTLHGATPVTIVPVVHFERVNDKIQSTNEAICIGGDDKDRLLPTSLGERVAAYLEETVPSLVDAAFTASMEDNLDRIASGELSKTKMLDDFYQQFHPHIEKAAAKSKQIAKVARVEGSKQIRPPLKTFHDGIELRSTRFGPALRIPKVDGASQWIGVGAFCSWKQKSVELLAAEEVRFLVSLPRDLGNGNELAYGRFGLYIRSTQPDGSMNNERLPKTLWERAYNGTLEMHHLAKKKSYKSMQ